MLTARRSRRGTTLAAAAAALALCLPAAAPAHEVDLAIGARKLTIRTAGGGDRQRMKFATKRQIQIGLWHDPTQTPTWLLLRGYGPFDGTTGRIDLDPLRWSARGNPSNPSSYRYLDPTGSRGGVTKIVLGRGKLVIRAGGTSWPWHPYGSLTAVWVYFGIEDESYCASFGGDVRHNEVGYFQAKNAISPGSCRPSICSNGEVELGEACDDGNLVENDGCTTDCESGVCEGASYASTYAAIQQLVFEDNGCTNLLCHGAAPGQGDLDLSPAVAYADMLDVPAAGSVYDRIEPAAPNASALYLKLLKATEPDTDIPGDAMPTGLPPIHPDLLEAVRMWILSGAPEAGTVAGTESLLGGCFPDPGPISIAPLEPPDAAEGFQLEMPPTPLPASTELEVCFATYYDVTDEVPAAFKDPTGQFFYSTRDVTRQDPHSHHLVIMHAALPDSAATDSSFGTWRCVSGASHGQVCDPIDTGSCGEGWCRSRLGSEVACIGFGPAGGPTAANPANALGGAGNGQISSELPPGLYRKIPLKGFVYWNLHAFNLTSQNHDVKSYLNLYYSPEGQYEVDSFTDFHAIYIAAGQAPFTKGTYCSTHTFPRGTRLFLLSSHTHQRGEVFWIEDPQGVEIYRSFIYNDPAVEEYDPPFAFDSLDAAERRLTYCATYNNGVAPDGSPDPTTVRKRSVTPANAYACTPTACTAGRVGSPCAGVSDHVSCDTFLGAGDGYCDACPITAGVSTEDEMFVLTGRTYRVTLP